MHEIGTHTGHTYTSHTLTHIQNANGGIEFNFQTVFQYRIILKRETLLLLYTVMLVDSLEFVVIEKPTFDKRCNS